MKHIYIFLFLFLGSLSAAAQPATAKKALPSVFTLKTFDAEGKMIASTTGFYCSQTGEAVSPYAPFKGAVRALTIDGTGKEAEVEEMLGANEIYDVAKFRTNAKRSQPLTIATTAAVIGSEAWIVPYAHKKAAPAVHATVSQTQLIADSAATYYTLQTPAQDALVGSPVLGQDGNVIAMVQPAAKAGSPQTFAIAANYATALKIRGLSLNDPALKATKIRKALPDERDQAEVTLYIASFGNDSTVFDDITERFIAKFPNSPDGYTYRAKRATAGGRYDAAQADLSRAMEVAEKKDEVRLLQAQLNYVRGNYKAALEDYNIINTSAPTAQTYYEAAETQLALTDSIAALELMGKAIATFSKPYLKTAAPYIMARIQLLVTLGRKEEAIPDIREYEELMKVRVRVEE